MRSTEARFVLSLLSFAALTLSAAACSSVFGRTDAGRPLLDLIALPSESFEVTYDLTESGSGRAFVWRQGEGMRRFDAATLGGFDSPVSGAFRVMDQFRTQSNLPVSYYDCTWVRNGSREANVDCSRSIGGVPIIGDLEVVMLDGKVRGRTESREIAGREVQCYEYESRRFNLVGDVCIDDDLRAPLAISIEDPSTGAKTSLEGRSIGSSEGPLLPPTIPPLTPDAGTVARRSLEEMYIPDAFVFHAEP
jgi:hypothetical protein